MTNDEIWSVWADVIGVDVGIDPIPFARAILNAAPSTQAVGEEDKFEWARKVYDVSESAPGELQRFWDYAVKCADALRSTAPTTGSAPDAVLAALDRMCSPLDKSWLTGVTAEEDARCMQIIRDYVLAVSKANTNALQKIVSAWDAADASTFVKVVDEARPLLAASMGGDRK
jgi:hypothetical protein